jgi:hypothetical protein
VNRYPPISGSPRTYLLALAVVVVTGVVLFGGWSWYLQGLEDDCRHQCAAKGKSYRYVEATGSGKRLRPGVCSCL